MTVRELFYLRRSDRNILLGFLLLATVFLATVFFAGNSLPDDGRAELADSVETAEARHYADRASPRSSRATPYYYAGERKVEQFPFDPNTADSTMLLRLGLQPFQVRNIYRYRASGGVYRRKEDFARLYGLTKGEYRRLEPYIRIGDDYQPAANQLYRFEPKEARDTALYPVKMAPSERIALNSADTTQLRKVPGIGSYFASRLVQYRQRLGGFYSVRQLLEIEDFPESALAFFVIPDGETLRPLRVNKLTLNELKRHPYLNYYQARAIVDCRRLYGPIGSLDDLRLLPDFSDADLERLQPYVSFD